MALQHVAHPTFGVQFHPESILTTDGQAIIANFLEASGIAFEATDMQHELRPARPRCRSTTVPVTPVGY